MADDVWYYEKDGQQHGPVPDAEFKTLIESGEISRHNLAWRPGEKDWTETGTFEVLLPAFRTPPPVPSPPTGHLPPPMPQAGQALPEASPVPGPPPQPTTSWIQRFIDWVPKVGEAVWKLWNLAKSNPVTAGSSTSVFALLLAVFLKFCVPPTHPPPPPPQEVVAATALHGTRVPVGYTGPVGQLKIDVYPWSTLTRLIGPEGTLPVPGSQTTPLVLLVAPGSYRVQLEEAEDCQMTVAEEQSMNCVRIKEPPVDAGQYYREVGW